MQYHERMTVASEFIGQLKERGHRITAARKSIVELLTKNTKPLGALDVHRLLSKKISINPTTVYRELQFLAEEGLLSTVQFHDGVQRYESASLPHHHHLVCLSCNEVEDVHVDHELSAVERTIEKTKRFTVERHSLEFYGKCGKCA